MSPGAHSTALNRVEREIPHSGATLVHDPLGALYWPEERLLAVADLHLEKGSSFAARGALLPPYDTGDTLIRLAALIARYAPRTVVSLGDNFHDRRGAERLAADDLEALGALQRGREWIWIAGNHDPEPMQEVGGAFAASLAIAGFSFCHKPSAEPTGYEISGHLHPVAVVAARGRGVRRRCFVADARRMIMPAFGAYAGGLNIRHRAFAGLLARDFTAHVMGEDRVYAIPATRCIPDWAA